MKKKLRNPKKTADKITMPDLSTSAEAAARQGDGSITPGEIESELGFPIVGIGASAGGLEALATLFEAMPVDTGAGFVVVVHLDRTHVSIMPELLQKHTMMPVSQIEDGMAVIPNNVFVIPPNQDVSILHGRLTLTELPQPRGTKLPIDQFLRSLAQDQGPNAVCIILSGTGNDGTVGIRAIKNAVGMVMVQDEQSAKFEGMPQSAAGTGLVDYVLPPADMPAQLMKYIRNMARSGTKGLGPFDAPIPGVLQKIFVILRSRTEHDFSTYKKNTVCRRIERRMNVHQIDNIEDYARFLQESDTEADILYKELLIGVTNFFRDREAFQVLETTILPKLLQEKPDDYAFRVWIPGCSTGEEAYSIAIVLHECMEQIGRHCRVQIFGTDIDDDAINVARSGLYPEAIEADVDPGRVGRYFTKENGGLYRVKKVIRETIVFAPQNVIKDPPFTKIDLICCRNLLIYLSAEMQRKLLAIFHYSLKSGGILFLGSSETIGTATDIFETEHGKWRIFSRKRLSPGRLEFPLTTASLKERGPKTSRIDRSADESLSLHLAEMILQESNALPCVIINDSSDVVYIHGHTGRFLEPAEGMVSVNIVEMARRGLQAKLAVAIHQVAATKKAVVQKGLEVDHDDGKIIVNLTVKPIVGKFSMRGLKMVAFEETVTPGKADGNNVEPQAGERNGKKAAELEQELLYTRESLQNTIEELETSNEELMSINEELQSTNEELETSKEELQSLNEESTTVNAELQARNHELATINDDMKNLLDSTEIAIIFLDIDLQIRRATPQATEIVPIMAGDIGRPINQLASTLKRIDLEEYGRRVLTDRTVIEVEVESEIGRWYLLRARPYRTTSNVIDGVVMTFDDITESKERQAELKKNQEHLWQAQKMESIGRLAGGVAHDFNNLLTTIVGYSELIEEDQQLSESTKEQVREIRESADRATTLTRQLLAFSRKQILKPQLIDLNKLVANLSKMLKRLIGEDIDLIAKLNPNLGNIYADPGQIEQVLMNLVVNAKDAIRKGGTITIETQHSYLDEGLRREFPEAIPGNYVLLVVSDTGQGMTAETQEHIFEPFFTLKGVGDGTGLGLATVHGVVSQSGGFVSVFSESKRGATFKVYLPRIDGDKESLASHTETANPVGGTESILLVEDEEAVRRLARKVLEGYGYYVIEASNGQAALEIADKGEHLKIDLLVTDVIMPGMRGEELSAKLLEAYPDMKILFVSGYTENSLSHEGVLNEGIAFLQKPFSPKSLAAKVREIFDGE